MTEPDRLRSPRPGEFRPPDECANLITHGVGLLLSLIGSVVLMMLVVREQTPWKTAACAVYCMSLTGLYAASTLSHAFYDLAWRRFFRALDQAFIFILIAGSFTPFGAMFLDQRLWAALLPTMWGLALLGVLLVLRVRNLPPLAKWTYGLMGWLPVIALDSLIRSAPLQMLIWILAGGLFYSTGTVFLVLDHRVRYFHALWHTFVIAGSTCHYIAILMLLVLP
jgi:hemolysin III